eukprot:GHVR01186931.1.p1 GENE.GHVR01186931.1~~GHVR01186931.1.p1  ORF type:complete len:164 (+),score=0.21 GHVR01186931.1:928-1419(+)
MNYYEPDSLPLSLVPDTNPTIQGMGRLRILSALTLEGLDEICRKAYAFSNLLTLDKKLFPELISTTHFWCPSLHLGIHPAITFFPFYDIPELHKSNFKLVDDYYRSQNLNLRYALNPGFQRWALVFDTNAGEISFVSHIKADAVPHPFISLNQNGEQPPQSPK